MEGHFLIYYLALLISRILELKLENRHSVRSIQRALKDATCRMISNGLYSMSRHDNVFKEIEASFGAYLDQDFARIEQIRKYKKEIEKIHNKK